MAADDGRYANLSRVDLIQMLERAELELHRERSGLAFRDRVLAQISAVAPPQTLNRAILVR